MLRYALTKLWRYAGLYGWRRALTKALGRTRYGGLRLPFRRTHTADVSVIGCGQFAFSTLCFFLRRHRGNCFLDAFDIDLPQAESLARQYGFRSRACTANEVLNNPRLKTLYIASNHASHSSYAVAALRRELNVYVEKPVAVSYDQLVELAVAQRESSGRLAAGYNRPFAPAIRLLRQRLQCSSNENAFSISYHINGHHLPPDHWYRHPAEGTRVLGNLGHWIDLSIYLLSQRGLPDWFDIRLACANPAEPDDNLSVTLITDRHDIITMLLTARCEPFEGVSESINLQYGDLITRIDDFRRMDLWKGASRQSWRFSPKDVGHERAVLQPFGGEERDWREVELSTLLMLRVRDQLLAQTMYSRFIIADELGCFEQAVLEMAETHSINP